MIQIDKQRIYSCNGYDYKNYVLLNDREIRDVWEWRNNEHIRNQMYNKDIIPFQNHIDFINGLANRNDRFYWVVYKNNQPIGALYIVSEDESLEKFEIGQYLVPGLFGEGFDFFKNIFCFVFYVLKVDKLIVGVNTKNKDAYYLDLFFGQKFTDIKTIKTNGDEESFYICKSFTKFDFEPTNDKTIMDYALYVKQIKTNKNK